VSNKNIDVTLPFKKKVIFTLLFTNNYYLISIFFNKILIYMSVKWKYRY